MVNQFQSVNKSFEIPIISRNQSQPPITKSISGFPQNLLLESTSQMPNNSIADLPSGLSTSTNLSLFLGSGILHSDVQVVINLPDATCSDAEDVNYSAVSIPNFNKDRTLFDSP